MVCNKHKGLDLLVEWTPGHIGIAVNEKVDEEAKKAARVSSSPLYNLPAPLRKDLPRSKSMAQQEFIQKPNLKMQKLWKTSPRYEKMK